VPRLSRWFIGLALTYLVLGAFAGALMLGQRSLGGPGVVASLLLLHVEFMLAGWAMQLAMGIGYWILPRHRTGLPRGRPAVGWLALVLFNLGVLGAALRGPLEWPAAAAVAGHVAQLAGVFLYAMQLWPRLPRSIVPSGRSLPMAG
jgi:heme/copper-type cytochrome/quinol oxidase subunit 1